MPKRTTLSHVSDLYRAVALPSKMTRKASIVSDTQSGGVGLVPMTVLSGDPYQDEQVGDAGRIVARLIKTERCLFSYEVGISSEVCQI